MSAERLRTWERRHGLAVYDQSASGRRRIKLSEVPKIIAVSQLIAAGHPVGAAIDRVNRDGVPAPDVAALSAMFDGVSQPVVAFTGPLPLRPIWANPAARPDGDGDLRALDPGEHAYRTLQRLLIQPEGGSAQIIHRAWSGSDARHRAVAWSVGHAGGQMPVVVIVGLPEQEPEDAAPDAAEADAARDLRSWVSGLRGARVALQRAAGLPALNAALTAFSVGVGADDAFLVVRQGDQLRICKSVHGELYRSQVPPTDPSWEQASQKEAGDWLSADARAALGAPACAELLAVPLIGDGVNLGFAVLSFAERPEIAESGSELLAGFASAAAASLRRDRMVAMRRRVGGTPQD